MKKVESQFVCSIDWVKKLGAGMSTSREKMDAICGWGVFHVKIEIFGKRGYKKRSQVYLNKIKKICNPV